MLVLLSAAYAVGIGGGEVARKLNLRPSQIVPAADTLPFGTDLSDRGRYGIESRVDVDARGGIRYDRFRPGRRTSH